MIRLLVLMGAFAAMMGLSGPDGDEHTVWDDEDRAREAALADEDLGADEGDIALSDDG